MTFHAIRAPIEVEEKEENIMSRNPSPSRALRVAQVCVLLATLVLLLPGQAAADCPEEHPVNCNRWCCDAGFICGAQENCCVPENHGDECPYGSCSYCPAEAPACVGWEGTSPTCCTRDSVKCNVKKEVWCCPKDSVCGEKKGTCK